MEREQAKGRAGGGDEVDKLNEVEVMDEIVRALEMPPQGVMKWMAHERAFCQAHGGEKVYPELMALFGACEEAVGRWEEKGRGHRRAR